MKAFGEKWAHEDLETISTPVGQLCLYCEEPIAVNDLGVVMPFMDVDGTREVPQHRECLLRAIFGSVGHQQQKCLCFGGSEEDPPGMSRREAAKAATELFLSRGAKTQP